MIRVKMIFLPTSMESLNLPAYEMKIDQSGEKPRIFDPVRKKYVTLTPEEWVRQHFLRYLVDEKGVPLSLTGVEGALKIYKHLPRRSDIVVYNTSGEAIMLVECKAPSQKITIEVLDQASRYTSTLKAKYLVVTNGMAHYCFRHEPQSGKYTTLENIPEYSEMTA